MPLPWARVDGNHAFWYRLFLSQFLPIGIRPGFLCGLGDHVSLKVYGHILDISIPVQVCRARIDILLAPWYVHGGFVPCALSIRGISSRVWIHLEVHQGLWVRFRFRGMHVAV